MMIAATITMPDSSTTNTTTTTTKCLPTLLPNNTLIEDLSKCHQNVTDLWPRATHATLTAVSAFRACWAPTLSRKPPASSTDLEAATTTTTKEQTDGQHRAPKKSQKSLKFQMPDSLNRLNTTVSTFKKGFFFLVESPSLHLSAQSQTLILI